MSAPSAPPVAVGGACLEMMELVDDVQTLLSSDSDAVGVSGGGVGSSSTLSRIRDNLHRHEPLLRDPLGLDGSQANAGGATAVSGDARGSATPVAIWRQGRNVPFNGGNMTQRLQHLELFVKGIRNPEQMKLKQQGMTERKARQILNDFSGKVDFVQKAHGVVNEQLGKLQRVLKQPRQVCHDLWVDAHKALWNPNSEIRSKLERYLGQRLEAFLDIGGLGSMAQIVGFYWPDFSPGYGRGEPKMVDIRMYNQPPPQGDMDTYRYKLEVQLEMRLAKHMGFLRRKMALDIVKQLVSARVVYETDERGDELRAGASGGLHPSAIDLVLTFTNDLLRHMAQAPAHLSQPPCLPKIDFSWNPRGMAHSLLVGMSGSLIVDATAPDVDEIRASTAKESLMLSAHALLALYHHTQILPQELALLAKLIHDLQERMYASVHRDDRRHGDSSNHVVEKLMEHPLFGVTTLLLLVFISAVDPAENHKLLRRTLPDHQQQGGRASQGDQQVDVQGRKLNDFTHARFGPAGNFHDSICDFTAEQFDTKVLFPFVANATAAESDPNVDPAHASIHPRNSQPFAAVMHFAWRLMRGGSAAEGTAGGGDPLHLAEQCRNLLALRPFAFLRTLLRYPGIRHDGHRDLYCSIIFDLFAQFLDHLKRSRTKLDVNQFSYLTTRRKEEQRRQNRSRRRSGSDRQGGGGSRGSRSRGSNNRRDYGGDYEDGEQWGPPAGSAYGRGSRGDRGGRDGSSSSSSGSSSSSRRRSDSRWGERQWASADGADSDFNKKDCLEDLIELVEELCRTTPATAQNFPLNDLAASLANHSALINVGGGGGTFALDGGSASRDQHPSDAIPLSSTFVFDVYEVIESEILDDPENSCANDADLLLVPFINMLEALSIDGSSAQRVYRFLRDGADKFEGGHRSRWQQQSNDPLCSWQSFFQFLELFAAELEDDGGSSTFQNNSLSANGGDVSRGGKAGEVDLDPDHQVHRARLCKAIMRLCQTVFRDRALSDDLRASAGTTSGDLVVTLFKLLPCPVSSDVKGEVMRTLAVLAKHTAETARSIWGLMETIQILKTADQGLATARNRGVSTGNRTGMLSGGVQAGYVSSQMASMVGLSGNRMASSGITGARSGGVLTGGAMTTLGAGGLNGMVRYGGAQLDQGGIEAEMDKLESYTKKYDAQFGFLCMLAELMRTGVPPDLGARRNYAPGAIPHLDHVTNRILLPFRSLRYAKNDPGEKWKLVAAALAVYFRTLVGYDIDMENPSVLKDFQNPSAFDQRGSAMGGDGVGDGSGESAAFRAATRGGGGGGGTVNQKGEEAGFYVMKQLITMDSDVLKVVLGVIAEGDGVDSLSKERAAGDRHLKANVFYGRGAVWHERAVLMALAVLRVALDREEAFMQALHLCHNSSLRVRKLSQSLLVHNTELLKIGCYVSYTRDSQICAHAIRIFHHVTRTVNPRDVAGVLVSRAGKDEHVLVRKLVAGFAMRLRSNNEAASQAAAEILQLTATFTCEGELDSERAWWMDGNIRDAENMEEIDSADNGRVDGGKEDDDTDDALIEDSIGEHVRQMVAELIVSGLEAPAPNVSHVLLGMHTAITEAVQYQRRGFNGLAARNNANKLAANFGWSEDSCYRAIVGRVTQDFLSDRRRSRLASLCYRIIFTLCRQPVTSSFVIKNLRNCISLKESHSSTNFWLVHLRAALDKACNYSEQRAAVAAGGGAHGTGLVALTVSGEDRVMPWIVQGATLEIFQGARSAVPMRDTILQFLDVLYSDNATDELQSGLMGAMSSANGNTTTQQHRMRVIELLQWLNLTEFSLGRREAELGGHGVPDRLMPNIVSMCSEPLEGSGFVINIPRLHQLYREQLHSGDGGSFSVNDQARYTGSATGGAGVNFGAGIGAGAGTTSIFAEREERVLAWAMRWNRFSKRLHQRIRTVRAWSRLVQITISECSQLLVMPSGGSSGAGSGGASISGGASESAGKAEILFHTVLVETLRALRSHANVPSLLLCPLAATASMLMHKLRVLHRAVRLSRKQCHDLLSSIVDVFMHLQSHEAYSYIGVSPTGDVFSSGNQGTTGQLKVHVYTLLLNYVRYSSGIVPQSEWIHLVFGDGLSGNARAAQNWSRGRGLPLPPAHNAQSHAQERALTNGNKDILDAAGPRLLRIILRDASAGTTVILRTAALRALDAVLSFHLDSSVSAELLREEGLIACFLNTFATVDNNMSVTQMSASGSYAMGSGASKPATVAPSSQFVAYLESTLVLFTRIALTEAGALMLVSAGVVERMASCRALRCPDMVNAANPDGETGRTLWHRLILPALQLVSTLLTTLPAPHRKLIEQACIFLGACVHREDYRMGAGAGVGAGGTAGVSAEGFGARIPLVNYLLMIGGAGSMPPTPTPVARSAPQGGRYGMEANPESLRVAYTPLRSRLGGVMLPTLAAMRRVSVCLSILGRCVTCPLALDTLNRIVLQTTAANEMSAGVGRVSDSAETDTNGGASGSTVGNIVRRVIDLLSTYAMPPSLRQRGGPPANKIARLSRSLALHSSAGGMGHRGGATRAGGMMSGTYGGGAPGGYGGRPSSSSSSTSSGGGGFQGLGVRPNSPVNYDGGGRYGARQNWGGAGGNGGGGGGGGGGTQHLGGSGNGSCWFSSVLPERHTRDTSWSQMRLASQMLPASVVELQQGMEAEVWTRFDHLKWLAGKMIVEHASFFCSVYVHIDPRAPVTTQSRVGIANSVALLFSSPRGIGQGAGAHMANAGIGQSMVAMANKRSTASAHDHINTNIRQGGAVGRRDISAGAMGSASGAVAALVGGGGRDVTACGFLGFKGSGFTLDDLVYVLEMVAREALCTLRTVEQIRMDLHVSQARGNPDIDMGHSQAANFRDTADSAMQASVSQSNLEFARHEFKRALSTTEQIIGVVYGHLDYFRAMHRNVSSAQEALGVGGAGMGSMDTQGNDGRMGPQEALQDSIERVIRA